jgi:predicted nucleotidyltransferase
MKVIEPDLLDRAVKRMAAALQPETIYLYGSHAYGQPHQDSDVDFLIVVPDSPLPPHQRAVAAYRAVRGLFLPAEIKVVTRAEFERRSQWLSSVERVTKEKGKLLYDARPRRG